MRLAFVSCIATRAFPAQPVWDWIRQREPDFLVLLGDNLYLDVPIESKHPEEMSEDEFARHLFDLYSELIHQPQFSALVKSLPAGSVWSTWDDHDFLWNDVLGAEAKLNPSYRAKIRSSTAFHEAFRRALSLSLAPNSFPSKYDSAEFWPPDQNALTTPSVALTNEVWLHLADVRTWRTRTWLIAESDRTILGMAQKYQFQMAMRAAPDAVHLLASGSTAASYKRHYALDWQWLLDQAAAQRTLILSGDIHRNESDAFFTGGFPLHEATSSGAAVKDAVVVGKRQRNYGLLDIDNDRIAISLFANNQLETKWSRVLSRSAWLPI